ncbi:DUF6339 family protein [Neptunomonas japonica]|uniref:DUF6339 family protein n=1 Tax=Neptunomonas japonica TaxID=417574 RepID=UPI0004093346|nr:DUF6339 family protein [Neptunomonas japonica]
MKPLEIISSKILSEMKDALERDGGVSIYQNDESYQGLEGKILLPTTMKVSEPAPILEVYGTRGEELNDAENAIKVYEFLGALNRTQAADLRLWVTLTHTVFWEYCRKRWTAIGSTNYVLEHWFEKKGAGLGALRRNSISRLWWAAHLTVAPWEGKGKKEYEIFQDSDRAIYTGILLSQQQIFFDVLERSYGSNSKIRICLLDALKEYLPQVTNKDGLSREVSKKLRLVLKGRHLEALPVIELKKIMHNLVEYEAENLVRVE